MSKPFKFRPKRDVDQTGNTNADRADRAYEALCAYATVGGYGGPSKEMDPCVMQDLINDLHHLFDKFVTDKDYDPQDTWEDMLRSADMNYTEER